MMLIGANQHHHAAAPAHLTGNVEQSDQPVDPAGRPRAGENHAAVGPAADKIGNHGAGGLAHSGHRGAAKGRLGMAVGVIGQHLFCHEILDLAQRAPRGGVIGVQQALGAKWRWDQNVVPDQPVSKMGQDVGPSQGVAKGGKWHGAPWAVKS